MLSHSKSGLKSEVIRFVLRRLMPFGKRNEKVRKALVYLPRYLAMTAPEKTELRACSVDTILAILRVMEDQIGFVDYVFKMCDSKESLRLLGLDILLMILMAYDAREAIGKWPGR
ncbi:hypothetical protein ZOSMA_107G00840 [Zostera marina]|uniref:Uncharacterized protein n=1 Tax=Zostera marina TaxID=29655 RepID=A0A0K9Q490_ZOSMR|nr:hypothetical protein ZOSMA_107G00840 [Zostera marina]